MGTPSPFLRIPIKKPICLGRLPQQSPRLATVGAEFLGRKLPGPDAAPECIQKRLCAKLKDQKHELAVWALAGRGWRQAFLDYVGEQVERFNTPRAANVDELVVRCLGLDRLSSTWSWRGMKAVDACAKLDELVTLRGAVAHRVSSGGPVHKRVAQDYAEFMQRLAVNTSNAVREYIKKLTGKYPWLPVSYHQQQTEEAGIKPLQRAGRKPPRR